MPSAFTSSPTGRGRSRSSSTVARRLGAEGADQVEAAMGVYNHSSIYPSRHTPKVGILRQMIRGAVLTLALLALFAAPASGKLRVGTLTLHGCAEGRHGWCGSLTRPLDPA